jgi:hypothetical protein
MPRKATIGPAVFERVNQLVGEGKSRTEAFTQIAQERGSRPGTIAANYYRTARTQPSRSSARRPARSRSARRGRAAATARSSAPVAAAGGDGDIGALANQISDLVQQLVRQVQDRDQRLRELLK